MRFYSDWIHCDLVVQISSFLLSVCHKNVEHGYAGTLWYCRRCRLRVAHVPCMAYAPARCKSELECRGSVLIYEFRVSCIASMVSVFWFFETHVPAFVWAIASSLRGSVISAQKKLENAFGQTSSLDVQARAYLALSSFSESCDLLYRYGIVKPSATCRYLSDQACF